ncbi:Glycosyl transferase family 2 [Fontimonas thermophila]|uniref:Glycosyl transferase family 2 n=1 Tax=Fontimonas thermophila TaxID=1076937 RepID=A0A1I2IQ23_9GAMM|nr:glycosyltransferase [Fontimonas thermophila]SFF42631.1 Glycosyl transferase family 2 [Fontimonas thermophila]
MDHHAVIRTYGNPNLPESTPERPLVTFAVFAYNQEKYIREAVEGAFAQTYSPLEIILSDDCSSDRTFEIMEQMAREYRGPHRVVVRRGEVNLGTAAHVSAVAKLSHGSLIIVAAGDDISKAQRSSVIVDLWLRHGRPSCCIHSGAVYFEDGGKTLKIVPARTGNMDQTDCRKWLLKNVLPFLSPTCAYTANLFADYPPLIGGSIIEDGPMALRCLATSRMISTNEALVSIRKSHKTSGTGYSISDQKRWNLLIMSRIISSFNNLRDVEMTTLDPELKVRLKAVYKKKIKRLSHFALSGERPENYLDRLKFLFKYIIMYPTSAAFLNRCIDAANVSGIFEAKYFNFASSLFKKRTNT